jgi:NodT family efflux transporter outer membrane factor (OMF) lipoprotein
MIHGHASGDRRQVPARGMRFRIVVWLLALPLVGCASLDPWQPAPLAIDVPDTWSSADPSPAAGRAALAQWWLHFDDPLLGSLVAQALQENTSVRSAQAALRQARALRDAAAAGLLPTIGSSASARHGTAGGNSTGNSFAVGLDASWELDIFGANRSALGASEATAEASAASLGDIRISVAAEVALAYIGLRNAQARIMIAGDNLASQQETLQITQWRQQAGLVTSQEFEQARAAVEQTRAQLPALQTSIAQFCHALAVLTGQPPAALLAVLATSAPVPHADDTLAISLPAETLRQRPDVRAAEHQMAAALARVSQAQAARLPDFRLGGSLGLSALTLGALTNGTSVISTLLASVSLPVFDGGALRAQVRAQQAAFDQTSMAYQSTVLTALQEVEDALVALRSDRQRLAHLQQAAEAAANASLLARQRFGSGLVDFQAVLETQRTRLSTEDSVAASIADVSADHVRLYKALGGGWTPDKNTTPNAFTEDVNRTRTP